MGLLVNLEGHRFGRLRVVGRVGSNDHKCATWECVCDCGSHKTLSSGCLRSGNTLSCGCLRRDLNLARKTGKTPRPPERSIWGAMLRRCTDPKNKDFDYYGGRGITVCREWFDFQQFMNDMGQRPSPLHTLERKDNDQGYSKRNCVWATRSEQMNNQRGNRKLTLNGITKNLNQWAKYLGIDPSSLRDRLAAGWPLSKALTKKKSQ